MQPEAMRAVLALAEYPRAAGRVAWVITQNTLTARGRGEDDPAPLALSAVIAPDLLTGLLPADDIAVLRALQLPLDVLTPGRTLTARLEALHRIGDDLPVHFSRARPA